MDLKEEEQRLENEGKTEAEAANLLLDREFYGLSGNGENEFSLLDVDNAGLRNRNQS